VITGSEYWLTASLPPPKPPETLVINKKALLNVANRVSD